MDSAGEVPAFTAKRRLVLVLFAAVFPVMVYGVMALDWWFPQMAAFFLADAIVIMLICAGGKDKMDEKVLTDAFANGASSLVGVSLIIGLARGVNYIMNQGLISDTLLYWSSNLVSGMNSGLFIIVMMLVFFVLALWCPRPRAWPCSPCPSWRPWSIPWASRAL